MHFLRSALPLGLLVVLGCDDTASTDTTGTASTTSDASSGASGSSSSTSSGTGGMGGSPAYTPPPVKTACAAPTKGTIHELSGANMERYGSPALGWDGGATGLAYAITDGMDTWAIHFQPVSLDGSPGGMDVTVANQQKSGLFPPRVALAMGAGGAMVCNDNAGTGEVRCFAINGGTTSLGLTVAGTQPALAFGSAGFALVYADSGKLWSQKLGADAKPDGAPHEVASSTSPNPAAPTLTATSNGYAALSSAWGLMWRFDGTFTELEGMAVAGWKNAPTAIAGSGAFVGAVFGESTGVKFRRVEPDNTLGAGVKIDAPMASSIYQYTAVARGAADTFAAVWSEYEGFIGYRAIDATGAPIGDAVDVLPSNWDDNAVAITAVSDGFIVASTVNPSADALSLVHLGCP